MIWTDEKAERLAELRANGASTKALAREFAVSRSAIIGKLNRMRAERAEPAPARGWSEERIERLIALYNNGVEHRDIAKALGVSESATMGTVKRLIRAGRLVARPRPSMAAVGPRRRPFVLLPPLPGGKKRPRPVLPSGPAGEGSVLFLDRTPRQCAFPCWPHDLDLKTADLAALMVCGDAVDGAGPYCAHHRAVTWVPVEMRRVRPIAA